MFRQRRKLLRTFVSLLTVFIVSGYSGESEAAPSGFCTPSAGWKRCFVPFASVDGVQVAGLMTSDEPHLLVVGKTAAGAFIHMRILPSTGLIDSCHKAAALVMSNNAKYQLHISTWANELAVYDDPDAPVPDSPVVSVIANPGLSNPYGDLTEAGYVANEPFVLGKVGPNEEVPVDVICSVRLR